MPFPWRMCLLVEFIQGLTLPGIIFVLQEKIPFLQIQRHCIRGIGLNLETGVGLLGVSFALAAGDSFTDGKIHFGIINEF